MSAARRTGPECYRSALKAVSEADRWEPGTPEQNNFLLEAIAYAQLANTAALVDTARLDGGINNGSEWAFVTAETD